MHTIAPGVSALEPRGYVALVLHAHLPYVRHPEDPHALEQRWLFEAITECYLPLVEVLDNLRRDGVPFCLTLSVSPTLLNMLTDPLLLGRYRQHLDRLVDLADREVARTAGAGAEHAVAQMYQHLLRRRRRQWEAMGARLLPALARHAAEGRLELITTAATHGFLPLLAPVPQAVRAQVALAAAEFRRAFGRAPRGFWLPECGYYPGLEAVLAEHGMGYAFLETHGLLDATPAPPHGVYAPAGTAAGVAMFARDPESSRQVWSSKEGYPGDYAYREYYRDIGFDLAPEHLGPHLHPSGHRTATGLKYHRITGPTAHKEFYDPDAAAATAARHAAHFVWCRQRQVAALAAAMDRPPVVVAPYDAELFGHWWFEGPQWLEEVARQAAAQGEFAFTTAPAYLARYGAAGPVQPAPSSWGDGGYYDYWLNGENHWLWRHLHHASRRMADLARRHGEADGASPVGQALRQAGRELLLAQASDWQFILRSGTQTEYARRRARAHLERFHRLHAALEGGQAPADRWLAAVQAADCCFPDLDPRLFC